MGPRYVLIQAGWHPGDSTGVGSQFHHAYLPATTMIFLGMILGQMGTAFAVRTRLVALRKDGTTFPVEISLSRAGTPRPGTSRLGHHQLIPPPATVPRDVVS
jgi:hypothetical protein